MPTTVEQQTARIGLEVGCACEEQLGRELYLQLNRGEYEWPMSVLTLDEPFGDWLARHRTAAKRTLRCETRGYSFGFFYRCHFADEIHEINVSKPERQGRPMSDGYKTRPAYGNEVWKCDRHCVNAYGIFDRELVLRAYSFVYRAGDLALVSQILGHGDHERNEIMFMLLAGVYRSELDQGGFLVYNRHDSGTAGLREFKEHFGFAPTKVEWLP